MTNEELERRAYNYVARHARYYRDAPPHAAYAVRYPAGGSKAFVSGDTRELVERVKEAMAGDMMRG
jgi:hypothetical protein